MTDDGQPTYEWYRKFFEDRAYPKICKDMDECEGLFPWLEEHDPGLYNKIEAADRELNSLWTSRADMKSFKDACKTWYDLLMKARKAFEAWKAKQQETAKRPKWLIQS